MRSAVLLLCCLCFIAINIAAQPAWQTNLDSHIRFYQTTDFGVVLAGTEKSLYAIDGLTGERIWRRPTGKIEETAVTPIPDTDLILFSHDLGKKSRIEAVDLLSGATIWQSEKVKGDVMQLAVDPENDLIALVLVKDPRGRSGKEFKKKPIIHVLQLSTGEELWKRDFDGDIEMMPSRFGDDLGDVNYTLDNYRAPLFLDGRLFLFYEGAASYDARTGKEKVRDKFKINENGLALTEADPVFDDRYIYVSGQGKIRAVDRRTGKVDWTAKDLGICAEMAQIGTTLYVRTGGQFTRLKDGETVAKGPFGVSAIDTSNGKTLWRFKGADKGLTNFVFADANNILIADKDDLITIDARNGKRIQKRSHRITEAQFVILNESGQAVVGGRNEIAAFAPGDAKRPEIWRVRHTAPARGVLRVVAGIALRATAIYFRYGGLATSALGVARGGLNLAGTINSFRWSGLRSRFGSLDLTTLASNAAKNYVSRRIYAYGSIARTPGVLNRFNGLQIQRPQVDLPGRVTPSKADVQDSLLDRLDPTRQAEKLSGYLLRRERLAELRGNFMYYYTDLQKPFDRKGLVGVNVTTGKDARFFLVSQPDSDFIIDETAGLLYSSDGSHLQAFDAIQQ